MGDVWKTRPVVHVVVALVSGLQQRAIDVQGCTLNGEVVPPEGTIVSSRNSTPSFGAGLMEAIPERTILGNRNRSNHGRPNYVSNPDTGAAELGALRLEGASRHFASVRRGCLPQRVGHYQPQLPTRK